MQANTTPTADRSPELRLAEIFRPDCIEIVRGGTGKRSVLSLLVRRLKKHDHIDRQHAEGIINDLISTEQHGTSALGKGLAFPVLRTPDVHRFAGAIGVAPDGINFGAADGTSTKLVFLTLAPWEAREELTDVMSRLVAVMTDKAIGLQLHQRIRSEHVYQHLIARDGLPGEP